MEEKTASEQIDDIISMHDNWKGQTLSRIRTVIHEADPDVAEEVKWKMKTRPEGLAVWTHNGTLCFAEIWKDNIKLLFPKGAKLDDRNKLFNARLESKEIRAIEFKEGDSIQKVALIELIREAIQINL